MHQPCILSTPLFAVISSNLKLPLFKSLLRTMLPVKECLVNRRYLCRQQPRRLRYRNKYNWQHLVAHLQKGVLKINAGCALSISKRDAIYRRYRRKKKKLLNSSRHEIYVRINKKISCCKCRNNCFRRAFELLLSFCCVAHFSALFIAEHCPERTRGDTIGDAI